MKKILTFILLLVCVEAFSQKILSVAPAKARNGESLSVTITGENVDFTQGSNTAVNLSIKRGGITKLIWSTFRTVISPTELLADFVIPGDTAAAPIGFYDVNVFLSPTLTLAQSFEVYRIQINKVTPARAFRNQTLDVGISGLNTHFTQGTTTVSFIQASTTVLLSNGPPLINNDEELISNFTIPGNAQYGYYDVRVYNTVEGEIYRLKGFEILNPINPHLVSTNYYAAKRGETFNIEINGKNTHFNSPGVTNTVTLYNPYVSQPITSILVIPNSETNITARFSIPPDAIMCMYDLVVNNILDGEMALRTSFEINNLDSNPPPVGIVKNNLNTLKAQPNPFKEKVEITYTLQQSAKVKIELFNILGEKVHALVNDELQRAGNHRYIIEKSILKSKAGLYFLKTSIDNKIKVTKLLLTD